jgi:hypothetical protein
LAIRVDNSEYPASLELHKLDRVIPHEDAKKDGDLRIIDESFDKMTKQVAQPPAI